jgi:hypothetical protein
MTRRSFKTESWKLSHECMKKSQSVKTNKQTNKYLKEKKNWKALSAIIFVPLIFA